MSAEFSVSDLDRLAGALRAVLGPEAVSAGIPLARYTAFRIGGPADLLVKVEDGETLRQVVVLAWEHGAPCQVLGGGSNLLVSDAGVRGLIILNRARAIRFNPPHTGKRPRHPAVRESREIRVVKAESGASFSTVARQCVNRSLAGLEWATGIPGTVGGAVVGNAGAWGSDVASTLIEATLLEPSGVVARWPVQRFDYGYRSSILKRPRVDEGRATPGDRDRRAVILEAEFALQEGEREALAARVAEIAARRKASQPAGATCGSVFKNPPNDYAGRLIEAVGLKGERRGDAEVSQVHANFIVNRGSATAGDVKALIDRIRQKVWAECRVMLELEIELAGDWQTLQAE